MEPKQNQKLSVLVPRVCNAEMCDVLFQVDYPVYWTHQEWVEGFRKLLDHFSLDKVCISMLGESIS